MKLNSLIIVTALVAPFMFAGCAGSTVDRDFRSKVKSDTIDVQGTYDPVRKAAGGEIRNTLEFRDPNP